MTTPREQMQIAAVDGGSALDKARGVVAAYEPIWHGRSLLDVGCRSREMNTALAGFDVTYTGLDIAAGADIVADLGEQIPLPDRSVDLVTALDVLEHTDDIHHAFAELCRVARDQVIVTLPNAYGLGTRLRILRGRSISAKYGLPADAPGDRHRWFFSLNDARGFMRANAARHGWRVADERVLAGPRRRRYAPLVRRFPNLGGDTYLCRLERV